MSAEAATALVGWLLTGGAVAMLGVHRHRVERDRVGVLVASRELASFREMMERARIEQDADPATALFIARYRQMRLGSSWPQLARLARNGKLTSRPATG